MHLKTTPNPTAMNKLLLIFLLLVNIVFTAKSTNLDLPKMSANNGDQISLPINVQNFKDIVSVQFSLQWDSSVIQYIGFEEAGLEQLAVGDVKANQGLLRISWFDVKGDGVDLTDQTALVYLKFLVIGEEGDSTNVSITDQPLEIQVFQGGGDVFVPVDLNLNDGLVKVVDALSFSAKLGQINCFGDNSGSINIGFTSNDSLTINWTGPNGFSSEQNEISNLEAGDYQLVIQDATGNTIVDTLFSIVQPLSGVNIDNIEITATDCDQNTGEASIQVSGGAPPYSFDIGNGPIPQSQIRNLGTGNYQLIVTDQLGCTTTQDFMIDAPNFTPVELGESIQLCEGEMVELDAGTHLSYKWSSGERSSAITISGSGTISVTVSDGVSCESADTITVTTIPDIDIQVETDAQSACPGEAIIINATGADDYNWIDTSGTLLITNSAAPIAKPIFKTNYKVTASNECSMDTANVLIDVFETLATAGPDTCIAPGASLELYASGGVSYEWIQNEFSLSDYNIPNPTIQPKKNAMLVVVIIDGNECAIIDSVLIAVATDPAQFVKRINLITPNGDGKNDVLEFKGIAKYGNNSLTVFNRWGDIVYQKINYQLDEDRFDGTYKSQDLPVGTYYYVLAFNSGEVKQSFTLLRE